MELEAWVRAQLPSLLRLATALSGSPHAAEDLVQDVLVKVYARWEQVRALEHPEAYLRRMLVNEHLSWRRRLVGALRRDHASAPGLVDQARPFDEQWVDRVELAAEIRGLPPRQRAVVVLRYLDDLSVAEVAEALDCTESTVRATASRALARLRITLPSEQTAAPFRPPQPIEDRHAH